MRYHQRLFFLQLHRPPIGGGRWYIYPGVWLPGPHQATAWPVPVRCGRAHAESRPGVVPAASGAGVVRG